MYGFVSFMHNAVNSRNLDSANHIAHGALKTHLLTNQNSRKLSKLVVVDALMLMTVIKVILNQ